MVWPEEWGVKEREGGLVGFGGGEKGAILLLLGGLPSERDLGKRFIDLFLGFIISYHLQCLYWIHVARQHYWAGDTATGLTAPSRYTKIDSG